MLVRGLSIAARLVAANLDALHKEMDFMLKTVDLSIHSWPCPRIFEGWLSREY